MVLSATSRPLTPPPGPDTFTRLRTALSSVRKRSLAFPSARRRQAALGVCSQTSIIVRPPAGNRRSHNSNNTNNPVGRRGAPHTPRSITVMNPNEILRIVDAIHRDKNNEKEIVFEGIEANRGSATKKNNGEMDDTIVANNYTTARKMR